MENLNKDAEDSLIRYANYLYKRRSLFDINFSLLKMIKLSLEQSSPILRQINYLEKYFDKNHKTYCHLQLRNMVYTLARRKVLRPCISSGYNRLYVLPDEFFNFFFEQLEIISLRFIEDDKVGGILSDQNKEILKTGES